MSVRQATPQHEAAYLDLCATLKRHPQLTPMDMLALTSNLVGKLIAMQDQRKVTRDMAIDVVMQNIERGNQDAIAEVQDTKGHG